MLSGMAGEGFIPVIRTITASDGSSVAPAEELRILLPLIATHVEEGSRKRIELSVMDASVDAAGLMTAAEKTKLAGITTGADVARWSAPVTGIAVADFGTGFYEQIFANRTGGTLTLGGAWINGGKDGMVVDAGDPTLITIVRRKLDGTSTDATFASYTNETTALPTLTDVAMTPGAGLELADGFGLHVRVQVAGGAGTDVPGGVSLYLVF